MSLVLEALRRVEKPDSKAGSVGVAVASYRPARRRRHAVAPLLLGLVAGAVVVFIVTPPRNRTAPVRESISPVERPASAAALPVQEAEPISRPVAGAAPLDPPSRPALPSTAQQVIRSAPVAPAPPPPAPSRREAAVAASSPTPKLILQAVSERDSYPIAIISDQLVKEGDLLGGVRVIKIGSDSVDVLLENGRKETVRFAPPPPPDPSPSLGAR